MVFCGLHEFSQMLELGTQVALLTMLWDVSVIWM